MSYRDLIEAALLIGPRHHRQHWDGALHIFTAHYSQPLHLHMLNSVLSTAAELHLNPDVTVRILLELTKPLQLSTALLLFEGLQDLIHHLRQEPHRPLAQLRNQRCLTSRRWRAQRMISYISLLMKTPWDPAHDLQPDPEFCQVCARQTQHRCGTCLQLVCPTCAVPAHVSLIRCQCLGHLAIHDR